MGSWLRRGGFAVTSGRAAGVAGALGVALLRESGASGRVKAGFGAVREIHRASECALQGLLRPIGSRGEAKLVSPRGF